MDTRETVLGRYLVENDVSRRRLARCADLPEKTISRLAAGKVKAARERVARKIAAATRWLTPNAPLSHEALMRVPADPEPGDVVRALDAGPEAH